MKSLPSGTATFLFTDIEGSTKLWENAPEQMQLALQRHHEILTGAIESYGGVVFQIVGDAFCAAFHTAPAALSAAIKAQKELFETQWDLPTPIRVRMGIHTGLATPMEDESATGGYTSNQTLNRVARIMSAGHGGQILLSLATEELCRDALSENTRLQDLGEHRLRDVIHPEHLFQLNISGLPCDFPPIKTLDLRRHNLPVQLTEFIGREKELTEIDKALVQNRLVTLIGSGGTGKTRLAIEIGAAQIINSQHDNRFPNGIYFIALAPLEQVDAIVPTIAAALGFSFYEGGEPRQQLLDYLREKSLLLILDNFEHLLPGVEALTEILNLAPKVKILATSRARLNIAGEQLFHLTGMPFPNWDAPEDAADYGAVKLFVQTARRVCPDFELTADNIKFIVRLCRFVEGIPLGIVLAASWMEMLSPEEIANEIEKSIDFLETKQRDLPLRQQSMRAVFDYSWKLLTPSEQNVFMKASVFRGGFTREAAQGVTGASLRDLMGLVDKSLIQRSSNGRYDLHELLRQYGAEKLAAVPSDFIELKNQHSVFFADYLHRRESVLSGKGQSQALADIDIEIENIHVAWDWATSQGRLEDIQNSLESLAEYLDIRSAFRDAVSMLSTAAERLSQSIEKDPEDVTKLLLARIQIRQGDFLNSLGDTNGGAALIKQTLPVIQSLGESKDEAYTLLFLGAVTSRWKDARAYYEKALSIFRRTGDRKGEALSLMSLSDVTVITSEFESNIQLCRECLEIFQELENKRWIATALDSMGYAYWLVGDYQKARNYHQDSLPFHREIGNPRALARALDNLAIDLAGLKEYAEAIQLLHESLAIGIEIGAILWIGVIHTNLAEIFIALSDFASAEIHARESLLYTQNHPIYVSWPNRILGEALVGLGDLVHSKEYLHKSLDMAQSVQQTCDVLLAIKAISAYFAAKGNCITALELISLINQHPATWQWTKDRASELAVKLESEFPPEVVAQAKERGRTRDLDATVIELLEELQK